MNNSPMLPEEIEPLPLRTDTDLSRHSTKAAAGAMDAILAEVFALYIKTRNFHRHMSGPHHRDYHLLLDRQAKQIFAMTDPIAAQIRKLGETTGAIATIHVNPSLDVIGGATLAVDSLFDFRQHAPCYIARGLYWVGPGKLAGAVYSCPAPITASPGDLAKWQTEIEAQLILDVNRSLTLVAETDLGMDNRNPANNLQTSTLVGTYGMAIIHARRLLDVPHCEAAPPALAQRRLASIRISVSAQFPSMPQS